ncbi:MAG: hypothetical protein RIQ88_339 [Actinomycetota bacterium]
MISIKELEFSYLRPDGLPVRETPLLKNVNIEIAQGEFVLVCGPTGSGKSTLLKTLNGLAPSFTGGALSGSIEIQGQDLTGKLPYDFASLVGFVNQQPEGSFVADTVVDEIVYAAEQLGISIRDIDAALNRIVKLLELETLLDRDLSSLSGGQQQRVAIAAALIAGQKILLLDEPTSALDVNATNEVLTLLKRLSKEEKVTVLLAEHRISRVISEVDSVLVVHGDGSVTKGKPETQFNDSRFAPPIIELGKKLNWRPIAIDLAAAQKHWLDNPPKTIARERFLASKKVIETKNLSLRYGAVVALEDINLEFFGNQITAVMGVNGSGKTSLCWAIQGLGKKDSGQVLLEDLDTQSLAQELRLDQISMVPQRAADLLFLHSLADELAESDRFAEIEPGTTANLFQKLAGRIDTQIHPRDLSAGQQLALVLSIQMAKGAKVLILDEPTRGLDYAAKKAFSKALKTLRQENRAIIIASHDVEFVSQVADRVVLLSEGKVVKDSTPEEILGPGSPLATQLAEISRQPGLLSIEQVI